ncbi:hypothetical protein JCM11491_005198 [Sporobolomyces phaffii]
MHGAPAGELVPQSPDTTHDPLPAEGESTVAESWFLQFIRKPSEPPLDPLDPANDSKNAGDSARESLADSTQCRTRGDAPLDQLPVDHSTLDMHARTGRLSIVSESQPTEGPGGSGDVTAAGYLGVQTQAESLDASWNKTRRLSDGETRRNAQRAVEEPNADDADDGDDVSVAPKVVADPQDDEETDQLESSEAEVTELRRPSEDRGGAEGHESQKENSVFPRSSLAPPQASAPFALRNSYSNLEPTPSAPSSSPVVALQLLNKKKGPTNSAPEPASTPISEPSASADAVRPAPTKQGIVEPVEDISWAGDVSVSASCRPLTSTPGGNKLFLPEPAPTQALAASRARSIPNYRFVSNEGSNQPDQSPFQPQSRPLRAANTLPTPALAPGGGGAGGAVPDLTLFGSSAAMAKPAAKGKKKREEWDGISQDTPEEQRRAKKTEDETQETEVESSSLAPTQIHGDEDVDEDEDVSMRRSEYDEQEDQERDRTPKPTAEQTISMELDEGDSRSYINDGAGDETEEGGGTLDASTIHGDLEPCRQPSASSRGDRNDESANERDLPPNSVPGIHHVLPSASSDASSPATSQATQPPRLDSSAQQEEVPSKKRLSDISEMRSSQEFPPTQYEVEATQKVYDAEKSQNSIDSVNMDSLQGVEEDSFQAVSAPSPALQPAPAVVASTPSSTNSVSQQANLAPQDSLALPVPPQHFQLLPSTQATQQVAESSPEVPLAKTAHLQPHANVALTPRRRPHSPSPSRRTSPSPPVLSPPAPRTRPDHRSSSSSNAPVVVPDSEGPTQDDDTDEHVPRRDRVEAGPSSARGLPDERAPGRQDDDGSDSGDDSLTDLEDVSLEQMLAAPRRERGASTSARPSKRSNRGAAAGGEDDVEPVRGATDDTPKVDRKGKGRAQDVDVEHEVPKKAKRKAAAPRKVSRASDGESEDSKGGGAVKQVKGKGRRKTVAIAENDGVGREEFGEGRTRTREAKKVVTATVPKGKRRNVASTEEDEDGSTEEESSEGDAQEETNYSDMPQGKRNRNKPSPKKKKKVDPTPVADAPLPARTPRRRASGPTIIEQTDDEEDGEEEQQPVEAEVRSRRKRKSSPRPEGPKPASKRSKRSNVASKATTVAKAAARVKKSPVSRSRTSANSASSRASRSVEPDRPVAGPSRLRFADRNESQDERDADTGDEDATDDEHEVDTKPSISGSRLPASAPFSRCFGLWRDDGYFYPGTILGVARELFTVRFDDGSQGKLRLDEVRRCELAKGDWIEYCGTEKGGVTETQSEENLSGDFRVLQVQKGGADDRDDDDDEGVEGQLDEQDTISAVRADDYGCRGGRRQSFLVEAIRILRNRSSQFDDRKVTALDLLAFEGASLPRVTKPLPLLATGPSRPSIKAFEDNPTNLGLFGRTAFLVTYAAGPRANVPGNGASNSTVALSTNGDSGAFKEVRQVDKDRFLEKLKAHGATIIDWEHLFDARVARGVDAGTPKVSFPKRDFAEIDTILLLADRPTTTMKFLTALALGIPCCSLEFANATIREGTRIDFQRYLLASGFLDPLKTFGIGGQLRAARKSAFDLAALEKGQESDGTFAGQSFLVVMEKPGKKADDKTAFNRRAYMVLSLLSCGSAKRIDFLTVPFDSSAAKPTPAEFASSTAATYTHVYVDWEESNSKLEQVIKPLVSHGAAASHHRAGLVDIGWIKLCLQTGHLEPPERVKKGHE